MMMMMMMMIIIIIIIRLLRDLFSVLKKNQPIIFFFRETLPPSLLLIYPVAKFHLRSRSNYIAGSKNEPSSIVPSKLVFRLVNELTLASWVKFSIHPTPSLCRASRASIPRSFRPAVLHDSSVSLRAKRSRPTFHFQFASRAVFQLQSEPRSPCMS
ncbi:hypothetical protein IC582_016172 [Cucumis melo]